MWAGLWFDGVNRFAGNLRFSGFRARFLNSMTQRHRGIKLILCAFLSLWLILPARADWQALPVSSLQKLTAAAPGVLEKYQSVPATLQAARGEWENFQIVVTADDEGIASVDPVLSDLTSRDGRITAENIHVFWENYVYVPHPSGNRHLQKLWWPDALIPAGLQTDTSLAPHHSHVLWINIRVPNNAAPGDYSGQIQIRTDSQTKSLPIQLRVEKITLPAPTFRANVAVYYDILRDWYAKNARPLNDSEFTELKKNYYGFLLDYRLNVYDLPVAWDSDAAQQYLRDPRVLSVRTPPLDRPDFAAALDAFKQANALQKAYYYWIDEPSPEQYSAVHAATKKLRALGIPHCVTAHPNRALDGAVDIWCPNIGDYFGLGHLDFDALGAERKKGREGWWYTMAWPRYPYPTWLLDDDASSVRIYGWLMARHGINGFVYSMAHGWGPKPLENLESFAGTNGDGTLLYPAAALDTKNLRPMPSIRLMLLRDALEDYELVRLLPENDRVLVPTMRSDGLLYWGGWDAAWWNEWRKRLFLWFKTKSVSQADFYPLWPSRSHPGDGLIYSAAKPRIDGHLDDAAWNLQTDGTQIEGLYDFTRVGDDLPSVATKYWLACNGENLLVAARCSLMPRAFDEAIKGEWFAVDLAPEDATVRWRFVVTPSGKGIIEKHTREGHFRIEGVKWRFAAFAQRDFYNIELQIPLEELGLSSQFRFNALRQLNDTQLGIKYTLRAAADSDDVTAMPLLELEKPRAKPVKH